MVCSQMPLAGTRCDVVLVPLHATAVSQLVVFELDGTDHWHKPRMYGMSLADAYNATIARDNKKERLVREHGMRFARIAICESADERTAQMTAVLDSMMM